VASSITIISRITTLVLREPYFSLLTAPTKATQIVDDTRYGEQEEEKFDIGLPHIVYVNKDGLIWV
jgi:hypothetical protein